LLFGFAQYLTNKIVRLMEWYAAVYEVIGRVGGEKRGIGGGRSQAVFAERGSGQCAQGNPNHVFDLIVRGEKGFFVLLKIALVTSRQSFQRSQQAKERGGDPARLTAPKISDSGVFLSAHQAAAC